MSSFTPDVLLAFFNSASCSSNRFSIRLCMSDHTQGLCRQRIIRLQVVAIPLVMGLGTIRWGFCRSAQIMNCAVVARTPLLLCRAGENEACAVRDLGCYHSINVAAQ